LGRFAGVVKMEHGEGGVGNRNFNTSRTLKITFFL